MIHTKGFTGIETQCDEQGNIVKKIQYIKGEVIAVAPGEWSYLGKEGIFQTDSLRHYERLADITETEYVYQHGTLLERVSKKPKKISYPKGQEIKPTFSYLEKRNGVAEVHPFTEELRAQIKKQEGRSTFQFGENATVCVLPSAKFYAKPGIMDYLDRTHE